MTITANKIKIGAALILAGGMVLGIELADLITLHSTQPKVHCERVVLHGKINDLMVCKGEGEAYFNWEIPTDNPESSYHDPFINENEEK